MTDVLLCLTAFVLALVWWLLMSLSRYREPLRQAQAKVQGYLWEVLLYGAYPKVMLRALASLSRACAVLSWSLLRPSLWFCLPLALALVVLSHSYAERPVRVGESFLLALTLEPGENPQSWSLQAPAEIVVEIDAFRTSKTLFWRLRALQSGDFELLLQSDDRALGKRIKVGDSATLLDGPRHRFGWEWLLSPTETPIPSAFGVTALAVEYPRRMLGWRGWHTPWPLLLLLAFAAWSWLLTLVRIPGNTAPRRQPLVP